MTLFTSSNGVVLIELNCKHDDDDLDLFLSTSITANEGYLFPIDPGGLVHLSNSEMIRLDRSWDKVITCFSGGTLFLIEADKPKLAIRVEHGDSQDFICTNSSNSVFLKVTKRDTVKLEFIVEMRSVDRLWLGRATAFKVGTLLLEMQSWDKKATRFRGNTSIFEGSLNLVITVEEENFVWRIAWNM
ncbi:OLC1v1033633C1 [Oldenlandia corymbosa var. corymbosa]|uniref:OLC1v1033633C1 n=1 Tax=Oldenlandia corymbosa var. corymbosa TaxID=529605 RepID=A0AAV1CPD9_OLDCO|nr:OLC1v1033633C1 [Oldenlandia corymbosa var. corymbosa]